MKNAKEFLILAMLVLTLSLVLAIYTHTNNSSRTSFNKGVDTVSYETNKLNEIKLQNFIGNNVQGSNIVYMAKNYNYKLKIRTYSEEFFLGFDVDDLANITTGDALDTEITYKDLENTKSKYYVSPTGVFYGSIIYNDNGDLDYISYRQKGSKNADIGDIATESESEARPSNNVNDFIALTDAAYVKVGDMLQSDKSSDSNSLWSAQESLQNTLGIRKILSLCREKNIACDIRFTTATKKPLFFSEVDIISDTEFNSPDLDGVWKVYKTTLEQLNKDSTFQVAIQKGSNENLFVEFKEQVSWVTIRGVLSQYCAIELINPNNSQMVQSKEVRKVLVKKTKLEQDLDLLEDYWKGTVSYLNGLTKESIKNASDSDIFMVQMSTPMNFYKGTLKVMKPRFNITNDFSELDKAYTKEEICMLLTDIGFLIRNPLEDYESELSPNPDYDTSKEGATKIFNQCLNAFNYVNIRLVDSDDTQHSFYVNSNENWREKYFSPSNYYFITGASLLGNDTQQLKRIDIKAVAKTTLIDD